MAVCQQACHQVRDEIGAVRKYQLGFIGMLSEPSSIEIPDNEKGLCSLNASPGSYLAAILLLLGRLHVERDSVSRKSNR